MRASGPVRDGPPGALAAHHLELGGIPPDAQLQHPGITDLAAVAVLRVLPKREDPGIAVLAPGADHGATDECAFRTRRTAGPGARDIAGNGRSEEDTSELQSLMP